MSGHTLRRQSPVNGSMRTIHDKLHEEEDSLSSFICSYVICFRGFASSVSCSPCLLSLAQ